MLGSRLARNRTSISSSNASTLAVSPNIDGTTTIVFAASGMPETKSMRGNTPGGTSMLAMRLTIATASWLAHSIDAMPTTMVKPTPTPSLRALSTAMAVPRNVIRKIAAR